MSTFQPVVPVPANPTGPVYVQPVLTAPPFPTLLGKRLADLISFAGQMREYSRRTPGVPLPPLHCLCGPAIVHAITHARNDDGDLEVTDISNSEMVWQLLVKRATRDLQGDNAALVKVATNTYKFSPRDTEDVEDQLLEHVDKLLELLQLIGMPRRSWAKVFVTTLEGPIGKALKAADTWHLTCDGDTKSDATSDSSTTEASDSDSSSSQDGAPAPRAPTAAGGATTASSTDTATTPAKLPPLPMPVLSPDAPPAEQIAFLLDRLSRLEALAASGSAGARRSPSPSPAPAPAARPTTVSTSTGPTTVGAGIPTFLRIPTPPHRMQRAVDRARKLARDMERMARHQSLFLDKEARPASSASEAPGHPAQANGGHSGRWRHRDRHGAYRPQQPQQVVGSTATPAASTPPPQQAPAGPAVLRSNPPPLSHSEKQEYRQRNQCTRCRAMGHLSTSFECPANKQDLSQGVLPKTLWNACGVHTSEEASAYIASHPNPTGPPATNLRPRGPDGRFTAPKPAAAPPPAAKPISNAVLVADPTGSPLLAARPACEPIHLNVEVNGHPAVVMLDGGASLTITSSGYASQLGLDLVPLEQPLEATLASGVPLSFTHACHFDTKLVPEAPRRTYTAFVSAGSYPQAIFLGTDAMEGLSLTYGAKPSVQYVPALTAPLSCDDDLGGPDDLVDYTASCAVGLGGTPTTAAVTHAPAAASTPPAPRPAPSQRVTFAPDLAPELKAQAAELLDQPKYAVVFSGIDEIPAKVPVFELHIDPHARPVRAAPRHFTPLKRADMVKQLSVFKGLGLIEDADPQSTTWVSAVTMALKKDLTYRLCCDYRSLNAATIPFQYPLPRIEDLVRQLKGSRYIFCVDFEKGYLQCPISDEASRLSTFITTEGLHRWRRMPFGLTCCPLHFQSCIDALFPGSEYTRYQDDIAGRGGDWPSFMRSLERALDISADAHLKWNPSKVRVGYTRVNYLGFVVGGESVEIDPARSEVISRMQAPRSKDELRSFLGLAQFFSVFVADFAQITQPLWELLRSGTPFSWGDAHQRAFIAVRDAIAHPRVLTQPDGTPLVLRTDASIRGISGVLLQNGRALAFFGRALTAAEKRYPTLEMEALAIAWSLDRAKGLIFAPVCCETDHSNLVWMSSSESRRVTRWVETLAQYRLSIRYLPGRLNSIADAISRLPYPEDPPAPAPAGGAPGHQAGHSAPAAPIAAHTAAALSLAVVPAAGAPVAQPVLPDPAPAASRVNPADVVPSALGDALRALPGARVEGGVVHLETEPPAELLQTLLVLGHTHPLAGHFGVQRTQHRLRACVVWPKLDEAVAKYCRECTGCQRVKTPARAPDQLMSTAAAWPFDSLVADHLGPLPVAEDGSKYVLLLLDRFTRWCEVIPVRAVDAATTASAIFANWLTLHGLPRYITSDGGSAFSNDTLAEVCRLLDINHHVSVPFYPQGHGTVERANHVVADTLRILLGREQHWAALCPAVRFAMNSAVNRLLGYSPYELARGYSPRMPLHQELGLVYAPETPEGVARLLVSRLASALDAVAAAEAKAHDDAMRVYSKNRGRDFEVDDHVLLRRPPKDKLDAPWVGPYLVVEKENPVVYVIRSLVTGDTTRAHCSQLAKFWPGTLSAEELKELALPHGEFLVESVLAHRRDAAGQPEFLVHWFGYSADHDSWTAYHDCSNNEQVMAYIAAHPDAAPRKARAPAAKASGRRRR